MAVNFRVPFFQNFPHIKILEIYYISPYSLYIPLARAHARKIFYIKSKNKPKLKISLYKRNEDFTITLYIIIFVIVYFLLNSLIL